MYRWWSISNAWMSQDAFQQPITIYLMNLLNDFSIMVLMALPVLIVTSQSINCNTWPMKIMLLVFNLPPTLHPLHDHAHGICQSSCGNTFETKLFWVHAYHQSLHPSQLLGQHFHETPLLLRHFVPFASCSWVLGNCTDPFKFWVWGSLGSKFQVVELFSLCRYQFFQLQGGHTNAQTGLPNDTT